jgi:hypothetical protein
VYEWQNLSSRFGFTKTRGQGRIRFRVCDLTQSLIAVGGAHLTAQTRQIDSEGTSPAVRTG